ncbi:MAG: Ig-like domain-containing protein, partial [Solirubrobacteraceae bacterium]
MNGFRGRLRRVVTAVVVAGLAGVLAAVLAVGASAAAGPTYDLQGGWIVGYLNSDGSRQAQNGTYTITAMDMSTGVFSGTAVVEGTSFAVQGSESGSVATYTLSEGGYTAHDVLNLSVLSDGHVGGNGTFDVGSFWAEQTTPTQPPTTTTGTTTTTTTGATLKSTATAVQCDYFLNSQSDTCTATVGDATGRGSNPTGQVKFSGDRTGACALNPTPSSPGVASCSITVPGTENDFLMVTATYAGDATHAPSSGASQLLTAAPGNGLYDPTIQQFDPQTLHFTEDNPVSGSTLTGGATLTEDGTADGASCQVDSGPTGNETAQIARRRHVTVPTLTVSRIVRHARRGKVKMALGFSARKLRTRFRGTHVVTLQLTVTVAPPHRTRQEVMRLERFTLTVPPHGAIRISAVKRLLAGNGTTKGR